MARRHAGIAGRGSVAVAIALPLLAGCSNDAPTGKTEQTPQQSSVLTAATLGDQAVLSTKDYLADERYAAADLDKGARQAQVCRACHSLEQGGPVMIGPNLYGIFGAPAGARPGYQYSRALAEAGFVWTPRALEAWLAEPSRFLPGNRMTFAGVLDAGNRADLVAYLLNVTDDTGTQ